MYNLKDFNLELKSTLSKPLYYFFCAYSLFIVIQYVTNYPFIPALIFYAAVVPSILFCGYKNGFLSRIISLEYWKIQPIERKLLLFLFIYVFINSLFLSAGIKGFKKNITNDISLFLFIACSLVYFSLPKKYLEVFFSVLTVTGLIFAMASIAVFLADGSESRLLPIGRAHHQILGASVYGFIGIISLYLFYIANGENIFITAKKIFYIMTILVIFIMILLTGSRGPMLSYIICIATGIFIYARSPLKTKLYYIFLSIAVLGSIAYFITISEHSYIHSYFKSLIDRGSAQRLDLWKLTLSEIKLQPFFGYGLNARLNHIYYAPHNIFLGSAYYLGLTGMVLFLSLTIITFIKSCRITRCKHELSSVHGVKYSKFILLLLMHAYLSGFFDNSQLIKGVSPLWIIFWLPVAMAISNLKPSLAPVQVGAT